jgi:hypothetical protein
MTTVPAGIYAGDKLYNLWQPPNGQTWSLTLWGEVGSYTLRQFHHITNEEPKESESSHSPFNDRQNEEYKRWKKTHVLFEMAGYPVGTYLGYRFFKKRQYTFGDAIMLFQGRGLGWLYSSMLSDIAGVDFNSAGGRFFRTTGTIAGILLLDKFIQGYDYTFGQSILSVLGTISGMAFALGTGVILEIDEDKLIETLVMTGGVAGFYMSNSILNITRESTKIGKNLSSDKISLNILRIPTPGNEFVPGIGIYWQR